MLGERPAGTLLAEGGEKDMTPLVWANFPLAALFILAIVGIPLWLTFKRPHSRPDFSGAHAYLAARARLGQGSATSRQASGERHTA